MPNIFRRFINRFTSKGQPEEDINVFKGEDIEKRPVEERRPFHSSDFIQKVIKPQHIDGIIIKKGVVADLPDGSSHTKAFFAEDESKLYIWNATNDAWESVTLS